MRRDLYADVSARIIAELERGAAPWVKPWSVTPGQNTPQNAVSNRPYSGCNVILLWLARNRGWAAPRFLTFKRADHFYNVIFHELTHWTGHKSRLDRDLKNRFGSRDYVVEELVAELGASFLSAEFGFDGDVRNAGYIATWIELLKSDKRAFFTACRRASQAAEYLRGLALAEPAAVAA